jgi:hypothetical protein
MSSSDNNQKTTTRKLPCGPAQARRSRTAASTHKSASWAKSTVHTVRPSLACMHGGERERGTSWKRVCQAHLQLQCLPNQTHNVTNLESPWGTRSDIVTIVYLSLRPCHRISVCLTIMGSVNIRYQRFNPHNLRFSWPLPGSKPHHSGLELLGCLATRGSNLGGCGVPGSRGSSSQEPRSWLRGGASGLACLVFISQTAGFDGAELLGDENLHSKMAMQG